ASTGCRSHSTAPGPPGSGHAQRLPAHRVARRTKAATSRTRMGAPAGGSGRTRRPRRGGRPLLQVYPAAAAGGPCLRVVQRVNATGTAYGTPEWLFTRQSPEPAAASGWIHVHRRGSPSARKRTPHSTPLQTWFGDRRATPGPSTTRALPGSRCTWYCAVGFPLVDARSYDTPTAGTKSMDV